MTRLVAYGCSYTAGTEIADHIVLNQPRKIVDDLKIEFGQGKWQEILDHFEFDHDPLRDLSGGNFYRWYDINETDELFTAEDINRSSTWVRYLAELRGHSHYRNRAMGGASLEHAVWFIEQDIMNGVIDLEKDKVIVQVPHPYRMFAFGDDGNPKSVVPNGFLKGFSRREEWKNVLDTPVWEFNAFNVTWRYYKALRTLKSYGISFLFLELPPRYMEENVHYDCPAGLKTADRNVDTTWVGKCWGWITDNSIHGCFDDWSKVDKHGWGHYTTKEQSKIAEYLNDKLGN